LPGQQRQLLLYLLYPLQATYGQNTDIAELIDASLSTDICQGIEHSTFENGAHLWQLLEKKYSESGLRYDDLGLVLVRTWGFSGWRMHDNLHAHSWKIPSHWPLTLCFWLSIL